jgi:hypothetical protein
MEQNFNLFLDDERIPLHVFGYTNNYIYLTTKWKIVRSYDSFVEYILKYGLPNMVSFDHDLADIHYKKCIGVETINYDDFDEKTGYSCAKWLVNYCMDRGNIDLPKYYIHTMNNVGGKNIIDLLNNYQKYINDSK